MELLKSHVMTKIKRNEAISLINNSIKTNKILNKTNINLLVEIRDNFLSGANIINKTELNLLNQCILHIDLIERVNTSQKNLRTKKIKQIETRIKKKNREFFKISRLLEYCGIFLLCILSISE